MHSVVVHIEIREQETKNITIFGIIFFNERRIIYGYLENKSHRISKHIAKMQEYCFTECYHKGNKKFLRMEIKFFFCNTEQQKLWIASSAFFAYRGKLDSYVAWHITLVTCLGCYRENRHILTFKAFFTFYRNYMTYYEQLSRFSWFCLCHLTEFFVLLYPMPVLICGVSLRAWWE